jgi:hypothetical protein
MEGKQMKLKSKLAPIAQISHLIREQSLSKLHQVAKQRQQNLNALAALESASQSGGDGFWDSPIRMRYESWADSRRREINLQLAQQTAHWLEAQEEARRDFGRCEALRKLSSKD